MIQIDAAIAAIFVTVLIALLGMAVGWGTLRERVNNNRMQIERLCEQNRQDHLLIFSKLDSIKKDLNGHFKE
uniref:Uncharacterized protein n=1 Tax=viral metagenome TaxID=1070528 RepID=A0A6M3J4N9_9ZZZZ